MRFGEFVETRPDEVNVGRVARVTMQLTVRLINEDEFGHFLAHNDAHPRKKKAKKGTRKSPVPLLNVYAVPEGSPALSAQVAILLRTPFAVIVLFSLAKY